MNNTKELVFDLAEKFGRNREKLLPILQGVVKEEKYLTENSMIEIAKELNIPASEVFGTATFYSFLNIQKRGEFVIRICKTITCSMAGKNQIILAIKDMLKINFGETTSDNKFTLLQTNCLGWCHKAPAMMINEDVFTELTPEKVRDILSAYMKRV